MTIATIDSLAAVARAVADLEQAHAEGRPVDGWLVAECRRALAKRTPGPKHIALAARLDMIRPRLDRLAPKSLKWHRGALATLELEAGALATGRVTGDARAALVGWLTRAIAEELSALDAKVYGQSGESLDVRMDRLLAQAQALGVTVPYGPGRWKAYDRAQAERKRRDEEFERRWGRGSSTSTPSSRANLERDALAHEFGVDLAEPPEDVKRRIRALAREAHPDHGGAHERMVKLNRLRELVAGQA